jgi:hypothetical protein
MKTWGELPQAVDLNRSVTGELSRGVPANNVPPHGRLSTVSTGVKNLRLIATSHTSIERPFSNPAETKKDGTVDIGVRQASDYPSID